MPDTTKHLLTASGKKELVDELSDLKVNKRKEVAQMLKEAKEQGDLSENAEYDAAKDEKDRIEARITEIELILKHSELIEEDNSALDTVVIGRKVKLLDVESNEEMEFIIVGGQEADPFSGRISNDSPVGKAVIGAKVGETITAATPGGDRPYKILEVSRAD